MKLILHPCCVAEAVKIEVGAVRAVSRHQQQSDLYRRVGRHAGLEHFFCPLTCINTCSDEQHQEQHNAAAS